MSTRPDTLAAFARAFPQPGQPFRLGVNTTGGFVRTERIQEQITQLRQQYQQAQQQFQVARKNVDLIEGALQALQGLVQLDAADAANAAAGEPAKD